MREGKTIPKVYDPSQTEDRIYSEWMERDTSGEKSTGIGNLFAL